MSPAVRQVRHRRGCYAELGHDGVSSAADRHVVYSSDRPTESAVRASAIISVPSGLVAVS